VTDLREIARGLWQQSRSRIIGQADDAVTAARSWSAEGRESDLADVRSLAHQLSGALGTYAAALRGGDTGDPAVERAAQAAVRMDEAAHAAEPDASTVLTTAESLRQALEDVV
jgi:hypothetical protein